MSSFIFIYISTIVNPYICYILDCSEYFLILHLFHREKRLKSFVSNPVIKNIYNYSEIFQDMVT